MPSEPVDLAIRGVRVFDGAAVQRGHPRHRGDAALQAVRELHAAGVPVLASTDAANPGTAHGASMHEWAGAMFLPGAAEMQPANLTRFTAITFWARSDATRELVVMLFADQLGSAPGRRAITVQKR